MTTDSASFLTKTSANSKQIIALDCDGVLLDYNSTFAQIYEKTFGKKLTVVSPNAFHATTMYGVTFTDEEKARFDEAWDQDGWRTMPTHEGALQACRLLHQAGYELVCVTAMPARFIEHRLENLRSHGFPIDEVVSSTVKEHSAHSNSKREIIERLHPVAFVDDLRGNFKDIQGVHTKLVFIDHQRHDDPYLHDDIYYDIKYPSLLQFVDDFLKTEQHGQDIVWSERPSHLFPSK